MDFGVGESRKVGEANIVLRWNELKMVIIYKEIEYDSSIKCRPLNDRGLSSVV